MVAAAVAASAAVTAGTSYLSSKSQASAAGQAAGLSYEAQMAAIAEQRRQYDQTREDLAPYRETGENALTQYAALYGIGRGGDPDAPEFLTERYQSGTHDTTMKQMSADGNYEEVVTGTEPVYSTRQVANPDYHPGNAFLTREEMQAARDRFMETPGYQFRFDEGVRALDRSASARGRMLGGGHERELLRYGQGIGAAEFDNYANRLAGIAGMGQGSTTTLAGIGQNTANNIAGAYQTGAGQQGDALMAAGTARASGYAGIGNAFNQGTQNYLLYNYLNQSQAATPAAFTTPASVGAYA